MKNIYKILIAFLSVISVLSCKGKVSDVTEITGLVSQKEITEVMVSTNDNIDTVKVVDGKFDFTLPTDITSFARISDSQGIYHADFIPDGTPLDIVLSEKSTVKSLKPEISVQEQLNSYMAEEEALMEEYQGMYQITAADTLLTDEEKSAKLDDFFEEFSVRYYGHHKDAVTANSDNFISVIALLNLRGQLEDEEMLPLIEALDPAIAESEYINSLKVALDARVATAEGNKYVDFTVEHVYGYDRSVDPQPLKKEVKFSDYVGKGTYVLVDFWSPWCGPCKREIPNIQKVYEQYKDKGLEVLSIAVWERQPQSHTIETASQLGMDWLHINNAGSVPTEIYGVEGIPHLMLIGPDGTILKRGFHGLDGIQAAVSEYIK